MRNLQFKYAKAVNFLCFGEEGVEIDFQSLGNIVLIKARNLDVADSDSSNGSGKSSLPEIITYGLFGKTIKKPTKLHDKDIINLKSGKKLVVEVRWDEYRVVRTRSPDSLHFWHSPDGIWDKSTLITKGKGTQKEIEAKLGLNYQTFINLLVFSDDPASYFLECDTSKKREIVENLLSLDKYREFSEKAKSLVKNHKEVIKDIDRDYAKMLEDLDASQNRVNRIIQQEDAWRVQKQSELTSILNALKKKRDELDVSDGGNALAEWQESQERIAVLQENIKKNQALKEKCEEFLQAANQKMLSKTEEETPLSKQVVELNNQIATISNKIKTHKKTISDINGKINKECPYCLGQVDETRFKNVLDQSVIELAKEESQLLENQTVLVPLTEKFTQCRQDIDKIKKAILDCQSKLNNTTRLINSDLCVVSDLMKIQKPDASLGAIRLQEQMEDLKKQADNKKLEAEGKSPFVSIKETADKEVTERKQQVLDKATELNNAKKQLPYYEFWVKAFGDTGIRKLVIDGIVPVLNSRIAYWLQYLIDSRIKLVFDNELIEKVDRYPFLDRPYAYHGMSGGQRRRLNLSIQQAFAYVMALNCGTSPSLVFLDEISMNMDIGGIDSLYRMITQLATEKQVFVIDHHPILLEMLAGRDVIQLEMKDEVTTRI